MLTFSRRHRRSFHRQSQATRWLERVAHHQRRKAISTHGTDLQHRTFPRWRARRRLETDLARPAPSSLELYNIPQDPSEKNNLAARNPDKVAELQKRANQLASAMVKPLFLEIEFKATLQRLALPPALPNEEYEFDEEQ